MTWYWYHISVCQLNQCCAEHIVSKLGPKICKWDMKQLKIVTIAPTPAMPHPGSLWGKTNIVCDSCYITLLFGVLFLFIQKCKECALALQWTIAAQTHATQFRHCCCFTLQKARMYSMEIDFSWADCWLVRSRSAYLHFISHLRIFSTRSKLLYISLLYSLVVFQAQMPFKIPRVTPSPKC